jgi:ferredoxin
MAAAPDRIRSGRGGCRGRGGGRRGDGQGARRGGCLTATVTPAPVAAAVSVAPATAPERTPLTFGSGAPVDRWVAQLERPGDCLSCGACERACATGAITLTGGAGQTPLHIDATLCTGCGDCVDACPQEALALRASEAGA